MPINADDAISPGLTRVPGLAVGQAQDLSLRTGVTVIVPDAPATAAVQILGGGPATRECDALGLDRLVGQVDAVVLTGGSVYGLAAADAVTQILATKGRGVRLRDGVRPAPIVPAAAIYDLAAGGQAWSESPYASLAHQAMDNLGSDLAEGTVGAGTGATAGAYAGGVGTLAAEVETTAGVFSVGALVVCNSFGAVMAPDGRAPVQHRAFAESVSDWGAAKALPAPGVARTNTTLVCVATHAPLSRGQCSRVAQMASAGLARSLRPVFTPFDGDVVFALSTAPAEVPPCDLAVVTRLGAAAADLVAEAVVRSVLYAQGCGQAPRWRPK